jgi:cystathionine gamma-lyase
MAAETTAIALLSAGDHIIVHDDLYGGTYRLMSEVAVKHGLQVQFVNLRDLNLLKAAIGPNTKMIWTETPTNPLMNLLDLMAIADIAKKKGVLTVCDNTFLSPYFQNPLTLGIDIVLHSTTKYINGHSDVVGGMIVVNNSELAKRVYFYQNALGTCQAPHDCFLVLRGLKTLAVRMEAHNKNALAIARWLEAHPKIEKVLHPGLESHPQHQLAVAQARGFGGTFSFFFKLMKQRPFFRLRRRWSVLRVTKRRCGKKEHAVRESRSGHGCKIAIGNCESSRQGVIKG